MGMANWLTGQETGYPVPLPATQLDTFPEFSESLSVRWAT